MGRDKIINKQKGITLISLVITIIVILILLSVVMQITLGDGLFKTTQNSLEGHSVNTVLEKLHIAKGAAIIEGKGKIIPKSYFERIEREGIIANTEEYITDLGNGVYEIITTEGYVFEVTLVPQPDTIENPVEDIEFKYVGRIDVPRVHIELVDQTTKEVMVKITGTNIGDGPYTYRYRKTTGENWTEINSSEKTITIGNLEDNTEYEIQVRVTVDGKTGEDSIFITTRELREGLIVFAEPVWTNGTAEVTIILNETTEHTIEYQIRNAEGETTAWRKIQPGETISGLELGDTLCVVITDGTNRTNTATITIEDLTSPTVEIEAGTITHNAITINASAVDGQTGIVSYEFYQGNTLVKTVNTSENSVSHTYEGLTDGVAYPLKVIVKDKAGNSTEATITLSTYNAVASINDTIYYSLELAVEAVPANNTQTTILLLKDTNEAVTIPSTKNIILNMDGHKLSHDVDGEAPLTNYGTIQINNGTIDGMAQCNAIRNFDNGNLTMTDVTANSDISTVMTYKGATTTIAENCVITSDWSATMPIVNQGGTVYMQGGTCTGNSGAVYNFEDGVFYISGTAYLEGSSTVIRNLSTMEISGGTISSTSGWLIENNGTLTITGSADLSGGRNLIDNDGTCTITGSASITATSSTQANTVNYGTIYVQGGTITANATTLANYGEATISDNANIISYAETYIAVDNYGNMEITGGTITNEVNGAVINREGYTLNISSNAYIVGKMALSNHGTCTMTSGTILSTNGTAAINELEGTMNISGSTTRIESNDIYTALGNYGTMTISAGTIFATSGRAIGNNGTMTITGGKIQSNGSTSAGIHNYADATSLEIKGSTSITSNNVGITNNSSLTISGSPTITGVAVAIATGDENTSATVNISGGTLKATSGDAVQNFGTFTMSGTTKITGDTNYVTIGNYTGATFNMNGGTVTSSKANSFSNKGNLYITAGTVTNSSSGVPVVNQAGTTEISSSASIINNAADLVVYNTSSGTLRIKGGTVTSNGGQPAVYSSSGTLAISSGTIKSPSGIAVVNISGSTATISGGTITGSTASWAVQNTGALTMTGSNVSAKNGLLNQGGTATLSGGTITAVGDGHAVFNRSSGTVTITGSVRLVGSSIGYPVVYNMAILYMYGGTITNTNAASNGCSLYNDSSNGGTVTRSGGTLSSPYYY